MHTIVPPSVTSENGSAIVSDKTISQSKSKVNSKTSKSQTSAKKSKGNTADTVYKKNTKLKVGDTVGEVTLVADSETGAPVTPRLSASFAREDMPSYIMATIESLGDDQLISSLEEEMLLMSLDSEAELGLHDTIEELSDHVRDGEITPEQAAQVLSDELANPTGADVDTLVERAKLDGVKYMIGENNPINNKEIALYTEKQYNDFGWASYNEVITPKEREKLFSLYADYKKNRHKYPTTRFGEAVISSSTEALGVIMYIKGSLSNPQITKIVRIESSFEKEIFEIQEEINRNEREHNPQPYEAIEYFYFPEILTISKARDYASFQEYRVESKRESSKNANTNSRELGFRKDSTEEYQGNDTKLSNESVSQDTRNYRYFLGDDTDTVSAVDFKARAENIIRLADMLQDGAKNDAEYAALSKVKKNAGNIVQKYGELAKLKAELKDVSFAQGPRDTASIESLNAEINSIHRSLNSLESGLASTQAASPFRDMMQRKIQSSTSKVRREYYDRQKQRTQSRKNTETRNKIKRQIQKLRTLFNNPTKERNVKIDMRQTCISVFFYIGIFSLSFLFLHIVERGERIMNRTKRFLRDGLILALSSVFMRTVGVLWNAYVSKTVGAESMGLLSLAMSVYGFAVTFACSGVSLGVTRTVSEALGRDDKTAANKALSTSIIYAVVFSSVASVCLLFGAQFLARSFLGDERCIIPIRIMGCSMIPIALSSVLGGYFNAVRRVYKSALSSIFEQLVRMIACVVLFSVFLGQGVEGGCIAIVLGGAAAEILSAVFSGIMCFVDVKMHLKSNSYESKRPNPETVKALCAVSVPIAVSAYIRSALLTIEHMLIPRALKKNGLSHSAALSSYGMLGGMVLPLVLYPAALTSSFASLLVCELSESKERRENAHISRTANKAIRVTFIYAAVVAGIMISYSGALGRVVYNSSEAGKYIRLLAPIIPIMYLDTVIDSMLKGLGYQVYTMIVNITDSAMSIAGVILLISRFGILGYVILISVSEIINASASFYKLSEVVKIDISLFRTILLPTVYAILACAIVRLFYSRVFFVSCESAFGLSIHICSVVFVYFLFNRRSFLPKLSPAKRLVSKIA